MLLLMAVVFLGLCRWLFRSAFRYDDGRAEAVMELRERDAIRDRRLLVVSLVVLAMVTAAFVLHTRTDAPRTAVVALVGSLVLLGLSRLNAEQVAKDVEWRTLVFFAGLFVMVGALVNTGVIDTVATAAADATKGRLLVTPVALLLLSAALSAFVDNIPYVATMSPVVAELVNTAGGTSQSESARIHY